MLEMLVGNVSVLIIDNIPGCSTATGDREETCPTDSKTPNKESRTSIDFMISCVQLDVHVCAFSKQSSAFIV